MPGAPKDIGDNFRVQFVWRIPNGDFLRALFGVEILAQDILSEKYVILLRDFLAARQESEDGEMRSLDEVNKEYWGMVSSLAGKKISLAFEADDGRPLWLRLETLTGEHNFFSRLNELPETFSKFKQGNDWPNEAEI
jgi:hypothetical protein